MPTVGCFCPIITNIPKIQIDETGTFKYILVSFHCPKHGLGMKPCVTVVRGGQKYNYHSDIYTEVSHLTIDLQ